MTREQIMEAFRNGSFDSLTAEDSKEIFLGVLQGSSDITVGLLEKLFREYEVDTITVTDWIE